MHGPPDGATAADDRGRLGQRRGGRFLLDKGADVNAADTARGQTPLMFAAAADRAAVVTELLKRGATAAATSTLVTLGAAGERQGSNSAPAAQGSPDRLNQYKAARRARATAMGGLTALHFAARDGQMNAARALVEGGADVNQPSGADKSTPLVIAISSGHYELGKFLLDHGADPNRANDDGLDAALRDGREAVRAGVMVADPADRPGARDPPRADESAAGARRRPERAAGKEALVPPERSR